MIGTPTGGVTSTIAGRVLSGLDRFRPSSVRIPVTVADGGRESTGDRIRADTHRVDRLLREHGGRMRQVEIVEATGWSKAKVSDLLTDMAESDQIEKLRLGRENIIWLPGAEPDGTQSPYER